MNRENRKSSAISHTNEMDQKYPEEIKDCIKNSKIYRDKVLNVFSSAPKIPDISYNDQGTVTAAEALRKTCKGKIAVLNFASYRFPGGGFLAGSMAQEEALCHKSYLYNILKEFPQFYEENGKNLNNSLYTNAAIYTPNVRFLGDNDFFADVITCAAPNKAAAMSKGVNGNICDDIMRERMEFVLDIAQAEGCEGIILGAFGCGVFGNDPELIAQGFKDLLSNKAYSFKYVIMGLVRDKNYEVFKRVFGG